MRSSTGFLSICVLPSTSTSTRRLRPHSTAGETQFFPHLGPSWLHCCVLGQLSDPLVQLTQQINPHYPGAVALSPPNGAPKGELGASTMRLDGPRVTEAVDNGMGNGISDEDRAKLSSKGIKTGKLTESARCFAVPLAAPCCMQHGSTSFTCVRCACVRVPRVCSYAVRGHPR